MDVLILHELLFQKWIKNMTLVRIHPPTWRKLTFFGLKLFPATGFDHKLPCYHLPSFLPVYSCVEDKNRYGIDSCVIPNQSKPTICHCPEFILVLNETVII